MPNWCAVSVRIEGRNNDIIKFRNSLNTPNGRGEVVPFSFFQLVPRPHKEDDNWYNWNCANWGTKWDARNVVIYKQEHNCIIIQCDTAWSPPKEWAINASILHPNLTFTVAYCGGGMEYYGVDIINQSDYMNQSETYKFSNNDLQCSECGHVEDENEDEDNCPEGCCYSEPRGELCKFMAKYDILHIGG
jgi:hypothetical protein